jgi:hypothetical protein
MDVLDTQPLELIFYKKKAKDAVEECEPPLVEPEEGDYVGKVEVKLSTETDGGEIYYTVDGEPAGGMSKKYKGPFLLTPDTVFGEDIDMGKEVTIRAITTKAKAVASEETVHTICIREKWDVYKHSNIWRDRRKGQEACDAKDLYNNNRVYNRSFEENDWGRMMRKEQFVRLLTKKLEKAEQAKDKPAKVEDAMQRLKQVLYEHYEKICSVYRYALMQALW